MDGSDRYPGWLHLVFFLPHVHDEGTALELCAQIPNRFATTTVCGERPCVKTPRLANPKTRRRHVAVQVCNRDHHSTKSPLASPYALALGGREGGEQHCAFCRFIYRNIASAAAAGLSAQYAGHVKLRSCIFIRLLFHPNFIPYPIGPTHSRSLSARKRKELAANFVACCPEASTRLGRGALSGKWGSLYRRPSFILSAFS